MQRAAEQAVAELGLDKYAALFVGAYTGTQDLTAMLYESWDLAGIDRSYREFIDLHRPEAERLSREGAIAPEDAFVGYIGLIDRWRQLPFRDPGLPRELLADDWSAPEAVALFEHLVGQLEGRALAHAARYW